jgi:hypothetical protein
MIAGMDPKMLMPLNLLNYIVELTSIKCELHCLLFQIADLILIDFEKLKSECPLIFVN